MPFSQQTVNFIFTFRLQHLFLLFMTAPSVTKSCRVLRKALTAVRTQQDKASSERLSNQFTFHPSLQRLKDHPLFHGCSDLPPKRAWEYWHSPGTTTQSSRALVLRSLCHWAGATLENKIESLCSPLIHNLVSSTLTSRQLWIFLHLPALQEWVLLTSIRRHPVL